MNVVVCRLMRNGIPDSSIQESIAGDLNLGILRHPVLNREVTMLRLIGDDQGTQPIEPLMDAHCVAIAAKGMWWRGVESGPKGRQQAQEWFVQPAVNQHVAP